MAYDLKLDDILGGELAKTVKESVSNYISEYPKQLSASLSETMKEISKSTGKLGLKNLPLEVKGSYDPLQFYMISLANGAQTYDNLARSRGIDYQTRKSYIDMSKAFREMFRMMFAQYYNIKIEDIDDKTLNFLLSFYGQAFSGLMTQYTTSLVHQYMKSGGDVSKLSDVVELGTKMVGAYNQAILGYATGLYNKIISDEWLGPKGAALVVAKAFSQFGDKLYSDIFYKSITDLYKQYTTPAQAQPQQGAQQQTPQGQVQKQQQQVVQQPQQSTQIAGQGSHP